MKIHWYSVSLGPSFLRAFLGGCVVGSVSLNVFRPQGSAMDYNAQCDLPGVTVGLGRFSTIGEAKNAVESAVASWVEIAGLQEKPDEHSASNG